MLDKIISARNWNDTVAYWQRFSPQDDEPSFEDTVIEAFQDQLPEVGAPSRLLAMAGIGASGKASLRVMHKKAVAAKRAFASLFASGNVGWSNVDAYHATFLYMRTYLAFFGIFTVHLAQKDCFFDILPHFGGGGYLRQYRKDNGDRDDLVRCWSQRKIEHRHIYDVYNRVSKVVTSHPLPSDTGNWMKNVRDRGYSSLRNRLIYGPTYWPESSDLDAPLSDVPDYSSDVRRWDIRESNPGWIDCIVLEQFSFVSDKILIMG